MTDVDKNFVDDSEVAMTIVFFHYEIKQIVDTSFSKLGEDIHSTSHILRKLKKGKTKHCHPEVQSHSVSFNKKYKKVVPHLFSVIQRAKEETGSPGISFAISHNGETVMKGGIGLADVENGVLCTSETIMRIASISKSLTSVAIGNGFLLVIGLLHSPTLFRKLLSDIALIKITTILRLYNTQDVFCV